MFVSSFLQKLGNLSQYSNKKQNHQFLNNLLNSEHEKMVAFISQISKPNHTNTKISQKTDKGISHELCLLSRYLIRNRDKFSKLAVEQESVFGELISILDDIIWKTHLKINQFWKEQEDLSSTVKEQISRVLTKKDFMQISSNARKSIMRSKKPFQNSSQSDNQKISTPRTHFRKTKTNLPLNTVEV